ncbi:hypothetical protein BDY21DRAFT_15938 [Lineolata rhizophorae]|uniref:Uncharacterized protein n=1 Tax=Lineolata rhizophorae TaxID=578093 RepID=A0A6A6P1U2_9PEZI|nr:hypothetical protein BDY21DRAFT_15938 [Lineolata rhizophorae]
MGQVHQGQAPSHDDRQQQHGSLSNHQGSGGGCVGQLPPASQPSYMEFSSSDSDLPPTRVRSNKFKETVRRARTSLGSLRRTKLGRGHSCDGANLHSAVVAEDQDIDEDAHREKDKSLHNPLQSEPQDDSADQSPPTGSQPQSPSEPPRRSSDFRPATIHACQSTPRAVALQADQAATSLSSPGGGAGSPAGPAAAPTRPLRTEETTSTTRSSLSRRLHSVTSRIPRPHVRGSLFHFLLAGPGDEVAGNTAGPGRPGDVAPFAPAGTAATSGDAGAGRTAENGARDASTHRGRRQASDDRGATPAPTCAAAPSSTAAGSEATRAADPKVREGGEGSGDLDAGHGGGDKTGDETKSVGSTGRGGATTQETGSERAISTGATAIATAGAIGGTSTNDDTGASPLYAWREELSKACTRRQLLAPRQLAEARVERARIFLDLQLKKRSMSPNEARMERARAKLSEQLKGQSSSLENTTLVESLASSLSSAAVSQDEPQSAQGPHLPSQSAPPPKVAVNIPKGRFSNETQSNMSSETGGNDMKKDSVELSKAVSTPILPASGGFTDVPADSVCINGTSSASSSPDSSAATDWFDHIFDEVRPTSTASGRTKGALVPFAPDYMPPDFGLSVAQPVAHISPKVPNGFALSPTTRPAPPSRPVSKPVKPVSLASLPTPPSLTQPPPDPPATSGPRIRSGLPPPYAPSPLSRPPMQTTGGTPAPQEPPPPPPPTPSNKPPSQPGPPNPGPQTPSQHDELAGDRVSEGGPAGPLPSAVQKVRSNKLARNGSSTGRSRLFTCVPLPHVATMALHLRSDFEAMRREIAHGLAVDGVSRARNSENGRNGSSEFGDDDDERSKGRRPPWTLTVSRVRRGGRSGEGARSGNGGKNGNERMNEHARMNGNEGKNGNGGMKRYGSLNGNGYKNANGGGNWGARADGFVAHETSARAVVVEPLRGESGPWNAPSRLWNEEGVGGDKKDARPRFGVRAWFDEDFPQSSFIAQEKQNTPNVVDKPNDAGTGFPGSCSNSPLISRNHSPVLGINNASDNTEDNTNTYTTHSNSQAISSNSSNANSDFIDTSNNPFGKDSHQTRWAASAKAYAQSGHQAVILDKKADFTQSGEEQLILLGNSEKQVGMSDTFVAHTTMTDPKYSVEVLTSDKGIVFYLPGMCTIKLANDSCTEREIFLHLLNNHLRPERTDVVSIVRWARDQIWWDSDVERALRQNGFFWNVGITTAEKMFVLQLAAERTYEKKNRNRKEWEQGREAETQDKKNDEECQKRAESSSAAGLFPCCIPTGTSTTPPSPTSTTPCYAPKFVSEDVSRAALKLEEIALGPEGSRAFRSLLQHAAKCRKSPRQIPGRDPAEYDWEDAPSRLDKPRPFTGKPWWELVPEKLILQGQIQPQAIRDWFALVRLRDAWGISVEADDLQDVLTPYCARADEAARWPDHMGDFLGSVWHRIWHYRVLYKNALLKEHEDIADFSRRHNYRKWKHLLT